MSDLIKPNRLVVDDRFSVLGFTIRTDVPTKWFEVALATDPSLFRGEAKARRTPANFYSSRVTGPLLVERGEAVYLAPTEVLGRFIGQPKLYFALATFRDAARTQTEISTLPTEGSPWIDIHAFTGRALRRTSGFVGGVRRTTSGTGYGTGNGTGLEWAGDVVRPEMLPIANAPGNPAVVNGSSSNGTPSARRDPSSATDGSPATASALTNGRTATAYNIYDDGFGDDFWSQMQESTDISSLQDDDYGIEGPIPDEASLASAQSYSFPFTAAEYPSASRFAAAASGNYRVSAPPRTINRIVIHITDGGPNINGTISWFQNPNAKVSAHYVVGQDGEVVQMVEHNNVAWHARRANGDSIGIEHCANTHGLMPTEQQYCASAALVSWLCDQYGIPKDRTHILGHSEADTGTSHTGCPNAVWDWEYFMGMVTSNSCYARNVASSQSATRGLQSSRMLSSEIPLDPGNGGRSIGLDALEMGDIILSTTSEFISDAIRAFTSAPVSHAMIYTGDGGQVVEAIGGGVTFRPLEQALANATVAVAFRYPGLTEEQRLRIRDFVGNQIERDYNFWGVARQGVFRIHNAVCNLLSGEARQRCESFAGRVELGTADNQTFFCSQLALAAYEAVGVSLTSTPAHWNSAREIANLSFTGALQYVGHLKALPVSSSYGFTNGARYSNGNGHQANGYGVSAKRTARHSRPMSAESFSLNWDEIEVIPQPTHRSCWATAGAMIVGWRDRVSISPETIAEIAGRTTATGLNPNDRLQLANDLGLVTEPPQSYSIDGFRTLLENNGPLWVGVAVPSGHAIVVTGIYSDGAPDGSDTFVRITDPWDRDPGTPGAPGPYLNTHNTGSRYILTWQEFVREYENRLTVNATTGAVNIQIMHAGGTDGRQPNRSGALGYAMNASLASSARPAPARVFSEQPAAPVTLALKELNYADAINDEEDPQRADPSATATLTNEETYRIIREVVVADSDAALYSAVLTDRDYPAANGTAPRQFGLAFGLALFTQESGRLGSVLRLMQGRDAAVFGEVFGANADMLLAVTNAASAAERLMPVGGEPLWSDAWLERFRRAGALPVCQAAQNEEAIEGQFRPMLRVAGDLGLTTDRALALAYDRVVTQGLGSALRWIVQAAGPLRTAAQREHALTLLGLGDLTQFQTAAGLPPSGRFTPATHAALVGALRRQGTASMPLAEELSWRLYVAATGTAKQRLRRLLNSPNFTDVVYAV
jgi:N-acetyl-anhydromuramyl-L-alanine amidase AmpD